MEFFFLGNAVDQATCSSGIMGFQNQKAFALSKLSKTSKVPRGVGTHEASLNPLS